jgi:hypothetical protein
LPSRKFDVLGPLPRDPELFRRYDFVEARSHLEALLIVQREGFGHDAVHCLEGEIQFADPHDQALVAGRWLVSECQSNSRTVEFEIPPPIVRAA